MSFNERPLRISVYFGFFVMTLGLIYIIYSVMVVGDSMQSPGYFTLIFRHTVGGVILISIGILGDCLRQNLL